ncbi:MAG: hypothetical protein WAL63_16995 [Solirubrobacteraceae bacterium]
MLKSLTVLAATALVVFGASSLAGAANSGTAPAPAKTVIAVLGPKVSVPAGRFVKAYALCPRGYFVTGGGAYSGAITEIISSPLPNLRGWFVDGTNTDREKRTFQHRADAVCARGNPTSSSLAAASNAWLTRQSERDFVRSNPATSRR